MTTTMLLTMGSVFLGFLCTGAAFAAFMYKKSKVMVLILLIIALVLVTVVPVVMAVVFGTSHG